MTDKQLEEMIFGKNFGKKEASKFKKEYMEIHKDCENTSCKGCNECCSLKVEVSLEQRDEIKRYINTNKLVNNVVNKNLTAVEKFSDKHNVLYVKCPFSSLKTKKCLIYEKRPDVCRYYHCNPKLVELDKLAEALSKTKTLLATAGGVSLEQLVKVIEIANKARRVSDKDLMGG